MNIRIATASMIMIARAGRRATTEAGTRRATVEAGTRKVLLVALPNFRRTTSTARLSPGTPGGTAAMMPPLPPRRRAALAGMAARAWRASNKVACSTGTERLRSPYLQHSSALQSAATNPPRARRQASYANQSELLAQNERWMK